MFVLQYTPPEETPILDSRSALEYISRVDWRHSRLGLQRIQALLGRMGNPQCVPAFVHVAGTNGKGSVCALVAAVLRAAGYTVGLYTSPFIHRFNERIRVNDAPIPDEELARITEWLRPLADAMDDHPTEFELVTAIAFEYFKRRGCDIVVLEVGLGGRLDATNIIPAPAVAAVSALGLDHTAQLGDTIEAVAAEKAGIIKPGCRAVSAAQPPAAMAVLREVCRDGGIPLKAVSPEAVTIRESGPEGQLFNYKGHSGLRIALAGAHQTQNAALAVEIIEALRAAGRAIPESALREGLAAARWPARFELLHRRPLALLDGAHNPQGAAALAENLARFFPGRPCVLVAGVLADKDWPGLLRPLLPLAARFFAVTPQNPRALPANKLAAWLADNGPAPAAACPGLPEALNAALDAAGPKGLVCAFGSLYMAGAVREYFGFHSIADSFADTERPR